MTCSFCDAEFDLGKSKSHANGFCSYKCYRKTPAFIKKYKQSFVKNRVQNIDINNISDDDLDKIFHDFKSESVIKSQSKRVQTIKAKGKDEFSRMFR